MTGGGNSGGNSGGGDGGGGGGGVLRLNLIYICKEAVLDKVKGLYT